MDITSEFITIIKHLYPKTNDEITELADKIFPNYFSSTELSNLLSLLKKGYFHK